MLARRGQPHRPGRARATRPRSAVSFAAPCFLLLLLLVPVAAAALLCSPTAARRAPQRRFASPRLLPSVAPAAARLPPPPAAARSTRAALAAVALALARPEATVAVPEERAAVVLVTDISGSMQAHGRAPVADRSRAPRRARLPRSTRRSELRVGARRLQPRRAGDRGAARRARRRARADRAPAAQRRHGHRRGAGRGARRCSTPRGGAGDEPPARPAARDPALGRRRRPTAATRSPVAREAARARIPIYTVALGTDAGTIQVQRPDGTTRDPPGAARPRRRCAGSPRSAARARSRPNAGDELATVYERLGSQVATRDEQREITAAFAGGAVALLLVGGALSLRWFGRLP